MPRLLLAVALAAMVPILPGAGGPLPPGAYQVIVHKSCQSWYSDCASRCRSRMPGNASCIPNVCLPRLAACQQSGCWQEPSGFHCDLAR